MATLTGADQVGEEPVPASGPAAAEDFTIARNEEAGAYELTVDGRIAAGLVYTESGTRLTILATSVLPEFRGRGIGGALTGGVLDLLRAEGRTVTLACPFAFAFVEAHPEYADVVDPTFPGSASSRGHGRTH